MLLLAICIVLQLGNLVFIPNPLNEEETIIANTEELKILSDMIGIPVSEISNCLTHKIMKTNRDTFKVPLKVADAKSTCDALAKECYRATFDWLVGEINESTCADKNYKQADQVSEYNCISVLDICGFECFEINGFEQLLINHTNERLQKTFTETIIDGVMEEYNKEGIPIENIEHDDNGTVIRFLEGKMGLMSMLNEECILPRGNDAEFVHKIYATHKIDLPSSKLFFEKNFQLAKNSKCMFGIQHFAKDVIYDATGFLKKNKDTLPFDVVSCAIMSTNSIIRDGLLLHESSTPKKKSALTGTSLWTSFEKQMTNLFSQIKQTRVWFVRCIIPNNDKEPFSLDLKCSLNQLRSVGLLAAMKMSQACFPNKQCFEYILHRFWFLGSLGKKYAFGKVEGSEADIRGDCEQLLKSLLTSVGDFEPFVIGRTRVYFREGALEQLEAERSKAYDKGASKIQAQIRGIVTRKMYTQMRIQSAMETEVVRHQCDLCIIQ
jgi:myosin-5